MKTNEAGSRPSDLDDRIEFPSGGPCSACGDGDTEQKYHKHVAPAPSGETQPPDLLSLADTAIEAADNYILLTGTYAAWKAARAAYQQARGKA